MSSSSSTGETGCLVVFVVVGVVFFAWLFDAEWLLKLTNAPAEGGTDRVSLDKKPHDCEFMTAPIGDKHCHYNKVVHKVMWATSTLGEPIRSFDDGKTWEAHTPGKCDFDVTLNCPNQFDPPNNVAPKTPTITAVIITWEKVQE